MWVLSLTSDLSQCAPGLLAQGNIEQSRRVTVGAQTQWTLGSVSSKSVLSEL